MAKADDDSRAWISFEQIYKRAVRHFGGAQKPALQAARAYLLKHPHAYLDQRGGRHESDLSADFVEYADFQPEKSCAILRLGTHVHGPNGWRTIPPYEAYKIEVAVPKSLLKPPAVDPFRTGAAGRPSASHHVLAKFEDRVKAREVIPRRGGLGAEAVRLAEWWESERRKNPLAPPLSARTIEDCIRPRWNELASKN